MLEEAALHYAQDQGLYVFPLQPRGKAPLTAHGLDDATIDPMTIETWWSRWPEANVGIRTGDIVVIDEDRPGAFAELARSLGHELPATRVARTASGRHYYFTQPHDHKIRNTAGKLAPGIDTRGVGGYVVAPPSVHPSGEPYAWEAEIDPIQLPSWLEEKLKPPERKQFIAPFIPAGRSTPYGQRALDEETAAVAVAPEGTRNDRLNTASFSLGQLVAGGELDQTDAWHALEQAATACGLSQTEATRTIRSGFTSGLDAPRKAPPTEQPTPALRVVTSEPPHAREERLITIETWRDFSDLAAGSTDFLISELWPAQALGFVASPPKKGKTWLGLSLALSVATGSRFLASFGIPKKRRVLYLALEGNRSALRARIGALCRGLQVDPDPDKPDLENFDLAYRPRAINLADPAWSDDLAALVAENNYELVIVDVLRNAARIKENDPAEFAALRANLEPTLALASVSILHHFVKLSDTSKERTPAERMSGTGAMYGALDIGLFITGSEDHARKLRIEFDGRDIAMPEPLSIYLEGEGHGPNGGFTYTDTCFWRGDINEVAEDDLAVPSIAVIDIVRQHGQIQRRQLIDAVQAELPQAHERTIIARIEKLARTDPPTLIRIRKGIYTLRPDLLEDPNAHNAHNDQ